MVTFVRVIVRGAQLAYFMTPRATGDDATSATLVPGAAGRMRKAREQQKRAKKQKRAKNKVAKKQSALHINMRKLVRLQMPFANSLGCLADDKLCVTR